MKTTIFIIIILSLAVLIWFGKKWFTVLTTSDYDKMVNALYSKTIPLLKAEEITTLKDYIILDTRAEVEYQTSHLPNATWVNYPNPDLSFTKDLSKDQAILLYCSVGYRSEKVGESLKSMGFNKVYNLYGGIFEWANKGFSMMDSTNTPTNKIHGYSPSWGKWLNKKLDVVYE